MVDANEQQECEGRKWENVYLRRAGLVTSRSSSISVARVLGMSIQIPYHALADRKAAQVRNHHLATMMRMVPD